MKDEIKEHMQNCVDREESCLLNSDNTKLLLDCITNLQEENEHLRTQLNTLENTVIEVNKECNRLFNHLTKKDLDYKTRNEKAIECIKHYAVENEDYSKIYNVEEKELLNILNGDDKSVKD